MDEPTLDAFAEEASEADEPRSQGAGEPSAETDDPADELGGSVDDEVPPIAVTYRFSTERRECVQCGDSGHEHWADEGRFVCPGCVEW
jgi:hypothetical protein